MSTSILFAPIAILILVMSILFVVYHEVLKKQRFERIRLRLRRKCDGKHDHMHE